MLGSDQAQRSNAVGHTPSYLPDADPGRDGGKTYTGAATEATIQDYENFFGPSARDIKTDLQRFKRHGRWHLPDVLKGPNPWLTDRIDGLITDATNSPFTTKILPYRYKDEVDGKIKWNVWNFDEGMASRVPYESAARTLQQSKRSFAGYMVRQGMAIVLEHNFMMTPKGRENFKNQLNQLIGSIQYTNDLDVHMALVLAPSYQKTMREKYYSLDKSPSQICREFVDLFGMMQKNVNALDILIEEGKAILRTWGGPMPDFLLCNSKLTFQMTMTPEKTNYITQGADGVKRLRQGPDLGSYRGLSVVHSRSFAMEVGQHPRDILRRRVRTAEYYRILPDKNNINREFEFYNEERDTWFTMTFQDLLRYARYAHDHGDGDNPAAVDRAFNMLSNRASKPSFNGSIPSSAILGRSLNATLEMPTLDARPQTGKLTPTEQTLMRNCDVALKGMQDGKIFNLFEGVPAVIDKNSAAWVLTTPSFDLGIKHIYPKNNRVWDAWTQVLRDNIQRIPKGFPKSYVKNIMRLNITELGVFTEDLFNNLKNVPLNDPFTPGQIAAPRSPEWFSAFAFYTSIYKRCGLPFEFFKPLGADFAITQNVDGSLNDVAAYDELNDALLLKDDIPTLDQIDITEQILSNNGGAGSVNHPLFLQVRRGQEIRTRNDGAEGLTNRFLLTYEIIAPLLRKYDFQGTPTTGIDYIVSISKHFDEELTNLMNEVLDENAFGIGSVIQVTAMMYPPLKRCIETILGRLTQLDDSSQDPINLAKAGIITYPMGVTSVSHLLHPNLRSSIPREFVEGIKNEARKTYGHLNHGMVLRILEQGMNSERHPWFNQNLLTVYPLAPNLDNDIHIMTFWNGIKQRLVADPFYSLPNSVDISAAEYVANLPYMIYEFKNLLVARIPTSAVISSISPQSLSAVSINVDKYFQETTPPVVPREKTVSKDDLDKLQDVEIVVVRPNIEHNMLGVIIGQGGETLGNTLWGQTELSVYDDSMHGIWGMSYKYHERAIVFNEKNLIRLWDIAYDGYNGGKDDTCVDWINGTAPNGYENFKELTLDVSKNYRGPSMMVMAFVHNRDRRDQEGASFYDKHFRRNWPSPIVFHDSQAGNPSHSGNKETLPVDYDNLQVIDVDEFRVFHNPLYSAAYSQYRGMMPHFHEMHMMRKTAGQSSADSETHTDSLAFQGSMRIKENGNVVQEIHGSGHHGPDYTGVASVRAGKGQKTASQAPTLARLI